MRNFILLLFVVFVPFKAIAGPHYLSGNLSNIASSNAALSIMLDTGVPDNCEGVPYGWMRIPEEDAAMVSMALSMWHTDKRRMTVYTKKVDESCIVYSLDPVFDQ
ncbi:Uncharacterised protein [BD1-7 clade bacterium]|uniref:Uncharacterized protein n=1 Tax=BD1-7 clade bacterium TaxID=2029982 RepID=A0A5S9Q4T2_9GAMM|nr:Uncharacterised protein [BD1-7 clade bacterium]CAA0112006.1 Uncharacterised protein [BD1-7 clade bacterium]